jgi:hypothetical protein
LRLYLGITIVLTRSGRSPEDSNAFRLAGFATLWFVLELLVVKEKLFPGREDEITPTVDTLQHLVLKFH